MRYLTSRIYQMVHHQAQGKPVAYLTAPDAHSAGTATQLVEGSNDACNVGVWVGGASLGQEPC